MPASGALLTMPREDVVGARRDAATSGASSQPLAKCAVRPVAPEGDDGAAVQGSACSCAWRAWCRRPVSLCVAIATALPDTYPIDASSRAGAAGNAVGVVEIDQGRFRVRAPLCRPGTGRRLARFSWLSNTDAPAPTSRRMSLPESPDSPRGCRSGAGSYGAQSSGLEQLGCRGNDLVRRWGRSSARGRG